MKRFCTRHGIADRRVRGLRRSRDAADAYVRAAKRPLVVKADGLAAGKGVVVASDAAEALDAIDRFMRKRELGDAGAAVVIEEVLAGRGGELPRRVRRRALRAARGRRRITSGSFDGDRGPNTGGMGAYAPAPIVTREVRERVLRDDRRADARGDGEGGRAVSRRALRGAHDRTRGAARPRVQRALRRSGDQRRSCRSSPAGRALRCSSTVRREGTCAPRSPRSPRRRASRSAGSSRSASSWRPRGIRGSRARGTRSTGLEAPLADGAYVFHAGTARGDGRRRRDRGGASARRRGARGDARGGRGDRVPSRRRDSLGGRAPQARHRASRALARSASTTAQDSWPTSPRSPRSATTSPGSPGSSLARVVAPPYDVIDAAAARRARRARSAQRRAADPSRGRRATRSTRTPRSSSRRGARKGSLVRDDEPAFYRYDQTLHSARGGGGAARRGAGSSRSCSSCRSRRAIVLPHERTLSGPKEDRLKLFRATRTNLSPGFMLYRDPARALDAALARADALAELATPDGVEHALAKVRDRDAIRAIVEGVARSSLLIADGHHRYETALRYSQETRPRRTRARPSAPSTSGSWCSSRTGTIPSSSCSRRTGTCTASPCASTTRAMIARAGAAVHRPPARRTARPRLRSRSRRCGRAGRGQLRRVRTAGRGRRPHA